MISAPSTVEIAVEIADCEARHWTRVERIGCDQLCALMAELDASLDRRENARAFFLRTEIRVVRRALQSVREKRLAWELCLEQGLRELARERDKAREDSVAAAWPEGDIA